jgi:hypothetical protein
MLLWRLVYAAYVHVSSPGCRKAKKCFKCGKVQTYGKDNNKTTFTKKLGAD